MSTPNKERHSAKILIPISRFVDRVRIVEGLHALSSFANPLVVLLHVIAVPSRTAPLDPDAYRSEISEMETRINNLGKWLRDQSYDARVKVSVARDVVGGIVEEATRGSYDFVFLLKRPFGRGLARLTQKSVSEHVIRQVKCLVITALIDETRIEKL